MGKLNSKAVESLAKAGLPGRTNDGDGLYLQIAKGGSASWLFRYKFDYRSREMGLGPYPTVSLGQARMLAAEQRKVLASAADPLATRDAAKKRSAKLSAKLQHDAPLLKISPVTISRPMGAAGQKKWRKGWLRKLELYAFPIIGSLSADIIQTEHILDVLRPIWATKTRTADEVRGQIEQILDAAKARRLRVGDNPARWRGHLDNLLSKAEKKRHASASTFPQCIGRNYRV